MNTDSAIPTNTAISARNQYWMPMTLWSRLKMYLRMKPCGAARIGVTGFDDVIAIGLLTPDLPAAAASALLEPVLKIRLGHHQQPASHLVVLHAAQLRAGDLVLARLDGGEVDPDRHAGHGVLLDPQLRHEEAVGDVLACAG